MVFTWACLITYYWFIRYLRKKKKTIVIDNKRLSDKLVIIRILHNKRTIFYYTNAYNCSRGRNKHSTSMFGRKTDWANVKTLSPEEWFRTAIRVPFTDHFTTELKTGFNDGFKRSTFNSGYKLKTHCTALMTFWEHNRFVRVGKLGRGVKKLWIGTMEIDKMDWIHTVEPKSAAETLKYRGHTFCPVFHIASSVWNDTDNIITAAGSISSSRRIKNYYTCPPSEDRPNGGLAEFLRYAQTHGYWWWWWWWRCRGDSIFRTKGEWKTVENKINKMILLFFVIIVMITIT